MSIFAKEDFEPHSSGRANTGGPPELNGSLDHTLSNVERKEILKALERAEGRRTLAARILGISRSRLYRRMDALGIAMNDSNGELR